MVRRDAGQHPSPNAGVVEAAFAGALDVRLGGHNDYHGAIEDRGFLGDGRPVEIADIARASRLAAAVSISALAVAVLFRGLAIMTIVILGGTAEARQLAAALMGAGIDVVSTLAGRVNSPQLASRDVSG